MSRGGAFRTGEQMTVDRPERMGPERIAELAAEAVARWAGTTGMSKEQMVEVAIRQALAESFSELPTTSQMLAVSSKLGDRGSRMEYWIAMCAEKVKQWA